MSDIVAMTDDGGSGGTIGGGGSLAPVPSPSFLTLAQIPLAAVPSQDLQVQLGAQSCRIAVYQKRTGLYLDLDVNSTPVLRGRLCHDRAWLVRDAYLGFTGDLAFLDAQGSADPDYTGLGDRFQLVWGT